jgi:prevent-host-death family protein
MREHDGIQLDDRLVGGAMNQVGSFDAKTHFSALLDRVERGETIEITRRGKTVALLVPAGPSAKDQVHRIAVTLAALRRGTRLDGLTIRELRDADRA